MLTRDPVRFAQAEPAPMTRDPAARILVDLSHAADGYVGVAQDLRLIFGMLCELDAVEVSGLLMPTGRHDLPRVAPGEPHEAALTAAVLHCMERNWAKPAPRPFPMSLVQMAQVARQVARSSHDLLPLADRGQLNALWRVLFAKTLAPEQRHLVLSQQFFATDLSVSGIIDRVAHMPAPWPKRLNAPRFDAVLFCMPRPVRLPRGVRQIVRFHDSVPVTDTDTVVNWKIGMAHSRLVRACARDAIFVCNSPQSRENLISLDPTREQHATVIPCAVAPAPRAVHGIDPAAVIGRHVTFRALGRSQLTPPAGWERPETGLRYVLSVSTLEPRKNFPSLIRAWERVVARADPGLKLVIVGSAGWREESLLAEMRPAVEAGRILHLHQVPRDELHALMQGAACFAFPSYNEGFGYSPIEAMQAGAPCVVSDIPVFRWVFGDAALYVDPYDVESIAAGIERVTSGPGSAELARTLQGRAEAVLTRFRPSSIAQGWEALLQTVRAAA
jgi:glycosyltransferase involved in cell wall biosynthesis